VLVTDTAKPGVARACAFRAELPVRTLAVYMVDLLLDGVRLEDEGGIFLFTGVVGGGERWRWK